MAMASGTDPLDRLQVGARALRAEREQCHAAADRACRTETGAAFSTVCIPAAAPDTFAMRRHVRAHAYNTNTRIHDCAIAHARPIPIHI